MLEALLAPLLRIDYDLTSETGVPLALSAAGEAVPSASCASTCASASDTDAPSTAVDAVCGISNASCLSPRASASDTGTSSSTSDCSLCTSVVITVSIIG